MPALQEGEGRSDYRTDYDACVKLWCKVLSAAMFDALKMHLLARRPGSPYERAWLRQVSMYDPMEFVNGPWFREVCGYVSLDHGAMRRRLTQRLAEQDDL